MMHFVPLARPHGGTTLIRSRPPRALSRTAVTPDGEYHAHISYHTGWDAPVAHFSVGGDPWSTAPLEPAAVSAGPHWKRLRVPTTSPLELVITDGDGQWDKAPGDQNYVIPGPGRYRLSGGALHPVTAPPVLVVTDLDDTLIGDDEATAAFAEWWRHEGAPAGGRLVFNTGRALDLFLALLEEKEHVMPEPDLLISSVGTKIYRKKENGDGWEEDVDYVARLDAGWRLEAVREAAYAAMAAVGKESYHFRPPSEMNAHKITCGVAVSALDEALTCISAKLEDQGVQYKAIVSGKGDWRFLDLVPVAAGKAEALAYAAAALGFETHQTAAFGDSGNDRDMLEGDHHAVVVGNAQEDLMKWARGAAAGAAAGGGEGKGPLIVEGHRAHGILEGLQRLGFRQ